MRRTRCARVVAAAASTCPPDRTPITAARTLRRSMVRGLFSVSRGALCVFLQFTAGSSCFVFHILINVPSIRASRRRRAGARVFGRASMRSARPRTPLCLCLCLCPSLCLGSRTRVAAVRVSRHTQRSAPPRLVDRRESSAIGATCRQCAALRSRLRGARASIDGAVPK